MVKPNITQLKKAIENGNKNIDNRLILNEDGNFEIVPYETESDAIEFDKKRYVTRWETFDKGNDYVGKKAADDIEFLNKTYKYALSVWDRYRKGENIPIINSTI